MPPVTVMVLVVGPIDPATNLGPGNFATASRAIRAAASLSSIARSCRPYSASTVGIPPNVFVATMSAPASK
jgi:hypothetical protein